MRIWLELLVDVVLAKGENRDEIGSCSDGDLDETLAAFEDEAKGVRFRIERLSGTTDDDGYGSPHAFVILSSLGKQVLARFLRYTCQAHGQCIVSVQWYPKIGIQSKKRIFDARK